MVIKLSLKIEFEFGILTEMSMLIIIFIIQILSLWAFKVLVLFLQLNPCLSKMVCSDFLV